MEALEVLTKDQEKEIEDCLRNLEACDEINPFETQIEELKDETKLEEPKVEWNVLPSLSYPKICPYYFSCSNSNQSTKLKGISPKLMLKETRVCDSLKKINEPKAPRYFIWSMIFQSTSMTKFR